MSREACKPSDFVVTHLFEQEETKRARRKKKGKTFGKTKKRRKKRR